MLMWAFASALFVVSHREFFGYHYLLLLSPFAVLTGYGIVMALGPSFSIREVFTKDLDKAFIILAIVVNLGFFMTLNYMHYTKFFYYVTGKITRDKYYSFFNAYPQHDYSFSSDFKIAQYIKNNTHNDDLIYALGGIESVIYFMTKRRSPSRFIFSWILFSKKHGEVKQAEAYRKELLADLQAGAPRYIITVHPLEYFKKFSPIYSYIKNNRHTIIQQQLKESI